MAPFNLLQNPVANTVKIICLFAVVASATSVFNTTTPLSNSEPVFKQEPLEIQQNTVVVDKPIFSSIKSTAVRKTVFFNYLLPAIEQKNAEILMLRAFISDDKLSTEALQELAIKYRLSKDATKEQMLIAIDILPPSLILAQAANESNWGRSRFAEEFNNYFGLWCFVKGCGTVPKSRDEGAKHEVATFDSLNDSMDYYMLNLNRNQAYQNLRAIRKEQRDHGHLVTGLALAKGLTPYAQTGDEYVASIRSLIRYNKLEQYDL
ncbi:MAG: glucosaminidase domain-containing protein [Gammaproteobacteria bacterium]